MRSFLIILLLLFFLAGNLLTNAQNFHFTVNSSSQYFDKPVALQKAGVAYVSCMYKDHRGFMWFGTGNGLYRFDGSNLVYAHHINGDTSSLINNGIINILEDSAGNLWIGTPAGGCILNAYTLKCSRVRNADRHPAGYKITFFTEDKKTIWAATDEGLYKYNNEKK